MSQQLHNIENKKYSNDEDHLLPHAGLKIILLERVVEEVVF